jgi:hypothetical protein
MCASIIHDTRTAQSTLKHLCHWHPSETHSTQRTCCCEMLVGAAVSYHACMLCLLDVSMPPQQTFRCTHIFVLCTHIFILHFSMASKAVEYEMTAVGAPRPHTASRTAPATANLSKARQTLDSDVLLRQQGRDSEVSDKYPEHLYPETSLDAPRSRMASKLSFAKDPRQSLVQVDLDELLRKQEGDREGPEKYEESVGSDIDDDSVEGDDEDDDEDIDEFLSRLRVQPTLHRNASKVCLVYSRVSLFFTSPFAADSCES